MEARPGELLAALGEFEAEHLPAMLAHPGAWSSLWVDYEPPHVERLWAPVEISGKPYRAFLHRIHPANPEECLFHPHPWPSAIKIVSGRYRMDTGFGSGFEPPEVSMSLILEAGCSYEMAHVDGWHSVCPLGGPSCSIMLAGAPWRRESHKPAKALRPLPEDKATALFEYFASIYARP